MIRMRHDGNGGIIEQEHVDWAYGTLSFRTGGEERMRIAANGNIGISTMLYVKLHVKHGSVIFEGDPSVVGGPFVMGPGNRMVWDERKRAFRVGGITGSQWDDVNVGDYSTVSGGYNNTASGGWSVGRWRQ